MPVAVRRLARQGLDDVRKRTPCRSALHAEVAVGKVAAQPAPGELRRRRVTHGRLSFSSHGIALHITMKTILTVLCMLSMSAPATAATFVYVSNAEDGDIGMYTL